MKFLICTILTCSVMVCLPQRVWAQPSETPTSMFDRPTNTMDQAIIDRIKNSTLNWQFGASFLVVNPQDSLRRALEYLDAPGTGYGFTLNIAYNMDPVPVVVGGEGGVGFFGDNSRTFLKPSGSFTDTIKYNSQNTHIPLNLFVRVQPNLYNWVFPYAEVVGGVTLIGSSLDITRSTITGSYTDNTSETSATWQYGVGAGVMVKIVDFITLPSELQRFLIDVRMRYLWGTSASVSSVTVNDDQTYHTQLVTVPSTENIHFTVGFAVQF